LIQSLPGELRPRHRPGPFSWGATYGYSGWSDYAARNGIGCTPGAPVKGGDGIMYVCQ
jgi:hypothetical protein